MAWMIVSDSSCEIRELKNPAPGVQFALVPFKIRVGEREYVDLATLNTQQMLQAMTDYNGASTTACPSPEEWAEYFLQADNVFAFTISSNLSGSYNAAMAAREMVLEEHPEKKIFVLDTLSCSGALAGAAELANKLIGEDQTFDDICFALKKFADSTHILFALASFDNLAKNGRVNRVVGFIAGQTAPKGRTMGHAGAIVGGAEDTAQAKMQIMRECGITVCESPAEIGKTMAKVLKGEKVA